MSDAGFRPDIEGLRAFAVSGVLLFHLSPGTLTGGFVGVDVFFVISGFLITRGLVERLRAGQFSFADFYARRLRRLLPAYLALLAFVYLGGLAILLPSELEFLGTSAIASVFYVSNMLFMVTDGYFSAQLHASPLLHTWSLSVEEQFYIFFPALLWAGFLWFRRYLLAVLVTLGAASYVLATHLASVDDAVAFFAAPTRFWQFLVGALLAFLPDRAAPRPAAEALTLAGLAAIVSACVFGSSGTPFPAVIALPPTLGAAAVIAGGGMGTAARVLLRNPAARFLGRISYSLYLWHWPIIVFYELRFGPTAPAEVAMLLGLSIAAGWLSTRFIEEPFRRRPLARPGRILGMAALGSGAAAAAGLALAISGGLPGRFAPDLARIAAYGDYDLIGAGPSGRCFLETDRDKDADLFDEAACLPDTGADLRIALVGDSHAFQYAGALRDLWPDADLSIIAATGCRPLLHGAGDPTCRALMSRAFARYLPEGRYDAILLAGRWRAEEVPALRETVAALPRSGARLAVLGGVMEYRSSLPRLLAFDRLGDAASLTAWSRLGEKTALDREIARALAGLDAEYYSVMGEICPDGLCRFRAARDVPMQFDYGHLTHQGAAVVLQGLRTRGLLAY